MIDIETMVFGLVSRELRGKFKGIYVTGEYVKAPPRFPCVTVIEMDNSVYTKSQSSGAIENHVSVTYEVNVYSNKSEGKKAECKAIVKCVDDIFLDNGFQRVMNQPIPNEAEATIYRIVARYRAIVSKNEIIFGG